MDSTWSPPAEFDDYVLLQPLGKGQMGMVYLAEDTVLDRYVAVKFIAALEPDAATRQRFLIEARAAARLQHPNVVAIYRVGELDEKPYLISEFVRGKSLADVAKPLPWARVLEIGVDLASGLAAAHRKGVLHCDIKSGNVILDEDGRAKLLDFGLAMLVDPSGDDVARRAESLAGTPDYLAPECWRGQAATRRSDVYSLGALLYELASGHPPHHGVALQALPRVAQEQDPPPLGQTAPAVDARFAALVERCLARDPAARPANGDEVRDALERLTRAASGAALPEGNPYRGLRAFDAEHRGLFFGRGAELRVIVDRLRGEPFVLVTGDSGVGKSSLCRAGVLPAVAENALGGGRTWTVAAFTPGKRPLAAFAAQVAPDDPTLPERLRAEPAALAQELRRTLGADRGLCLFADQLEEIMTVSDVDEAAATAAALAELAGGVPGVKLLATVRADFLTRLAAVPRLGEDLSHVLEFLRPLPRERTREVIVGPAEATGVRFESEALVEALVDATAQEGGGLPLLQFALAELWQARDRERGIILSSALEVMGGVAGALAGHADAVVATMRPAERSAARRILVRLVTAEGARRRGAEAELVGDPASRSALEALVRGRLLVVKDDDEGSAYELAHEVLISGWSTLADWLQEDAEGRIVRDRIARATAEWERLGRPRDILFSARQLAEAAQVAPELLGPIERAFVAASRRQVAWRRARIVAAVLAVPLLVTSIYATVELRHRRAVAAAVDARLAEARVALDEGRAHDEQAAALRTVAFGWFDGGVRPAGETVWSSAVRTAAAADNAYQRADQVVETALAQDAARRDVRALLGDILYERAKLAEATTGSAPAELVQRMSLYDDDGTRMRRWQAPATLRLETDPASAEVALEDRGGERSLGAVPAALALPAGTHVLVARAPGRATVRLPVRLGRGERLALRVELPEAVRVPAGYVWIPAGRFRFGKPGDDESRLGFYDTVPVHERTTGGYLIGRTEVTWADWLEYLRALPPDERARRLPSDANLHGALQLTMTHDGVRLTIKPADRVYTADGGSKIHYQGRSRRVDQDWLRFPVTGISADDVEAYAAWLDASGRLRGARLCSELEWERAARGADDRQYPHGDTLEPDDANFDLTYDREIMGPDEVGAHPASRSPFGLDDMVGNAFEWTTSVLAAGDYVVRGGSYYHDRPTDKVYNRGAVPRTLRNPTLGARICGSLR